MRRIVLIAVLLLGACTANVSITQAPLSERVTDACTDLASLCASSGNCLPEQTFCGDKFRSLFVTEDACKNSCNDVTTCLRACKATRVAEMTTLLASVDLNGDGTSGDGAAACNGLDTTCATTGQGCTGGEFFCSTFARVSSPCSTQLDTCKAACAPHERPCLQKCRTDYKQCVTGGTSMDAGVPDAPPTTTTYDLTYGTTAGSTGAGTVTVNPAGATCGSNCATYAAGTMVTLTATAKSGSSFTKWGGCTSTTNTCTVTMAQALTVTATFTLNPTTTPYNLTYGTTAGSTGTGSVTVNPVGASCGTNCATYPAGTAVTLTATASTGSSFTAWVGCTSTTSTCTVTMTQARSVTATFTKTTTTTSYTYTTNIAPKMSGLCNGCHSGASAPGNYFTDSYTALFGNGSDGTPNIIAGNANSLFVQKIAGNHHNVLNQYPGFDTVARDWVVNNNAAK
jgi:hypothetical protein